MLIYADLRVGGIFCKSGEKHRVETFKKTTFQRAEILKFSSNFSVF